MSRMRRVIQNQWFWWLLSGALFFLTPLHPSLALCGILAAAAFLHAAYRAQRYQDVALGGFVAGTLKAAGALIWIWYTYPLSWIAIPPGIWQLGMIYIYWGLDAAAIGIGMAVCSIAVFALQKKWPRVSCFAFPVLFVLGEIAGAFVYSLYTLGPGADLNAYFTFGYLGFAISNLPFFLRLAQFGGVYALSFAGALTATLIYVAIRQTGGGRFFALVVLAVCFAFAILAPSPAIVSAENIRTIAITTRFNEELFTKPSGYTFKQAQVVAAVDAALKRDPRIIILPEDSRFLDAFATPQDALRHISERAQGPVLVIDSARATDEKGDTVLRAYLFDTARDTVYEADKQYLVAQGEYVPYLLAGTLRALGLNRLLASVEYEQSYRPGPLTQERLPDDLPRVLFCSESSEPNAALTIADPITPFIAHLVSHSWFHDPVILTGELTSMLRVQATWSGLPILQAGNMAESKLYLPGGATIHGKELETTPYWSLDEFEVPARDTARTTPSLLTAHIQR